EARRGAGRPGRRTAAAGLRARGDRRIAAVGKLLVHVTHGPEHPTRAALGFLVAKAAIEEGHEVSLFLAGDAVQLLRDAVLGSLRRSSARVTTRYRANNLILAGVAVISGIALAAAYIHFGPRALIALVALPIWAVPTLMRR